MNRIDENEINYHKLILKTAEKNTLKFTISLSLYLSRPLSLINTNSPLTLHLILSSRTLGIPQWPFFLMALLTASFSSVVAYAGGSGFPCESPLACLLEIGRPPSAMAGAAH